MHDSDLHLLMLRADKSGQEWPSDFDCERLLSDISAIHKDIENALGMKLNISDRAQDATFSYMLQSDAPEGDLTPYFRLTFSNFGRMVLIGGNEKWGDSRNVEIAEIFSILICSQFLPLNACDVSHLYDGADDTWRGESWMTRFFSYC